MGWVGDSRAYWLAETAPRAGRLLTADHSGAAAAGPGSSTPPRRDPPHAITRWLGADSEPEPGVTTFAPAEAGALLLCTDGLWNYVPDPEELAAVALPAVARDGAPAATAPVTLALDDGGRPTTSPSPSSPFPFTKGARRDQPGFTVEIDQNPYLAPGATASTP